MSERREHLDPFMKMFWKINFRDINLVNAASTQCRLRLPFEIRQRYEMKSEEVRLLSPMIWIVLSLSERSSIRS